jgi:hypothetical protein
VGVHLLLVIEALSVGLLGWNLLFGLPRLAGLALTSLARLWSRS